MAGEYAVASEICRHDFYAQITMGHLKKTDILVYNPENRKEAKIEVKAKQDKTWAFVAGISGKDSLLLLVDFQNKLPSERPDFYVLSDRDWQKYLDEYVRGGSDLKEMRDNITPIWDDGTTGQMIEVKEVVQHKEKWNKLARLLE